MSVDHGTLTGTCNSCHAGDLPSSGHITTTAQCDDCHGSTSSWLSSVSVDHGTLTGTCNSCHAGDLPSSGHITTTAQCDDCHGSTSSWLSSVSVDHGSFGSTCNSCHTGDLPSSGHFVTTVQCDECHSTSGWIPASTYRHSSGTYPGDHNSSVRCVDCHRSNSQTVTWQSSSYRPDCAGCHAGDYEQNEHKKVDSPRIYYTVSELRNCAGACHEYTNSSMSTISRSRNSEHRVSGGGF